MAVTATQVGNDTTLGNRKAKDFTLVFSGNYPDEGEPYTAALFGYANTVDRVYLHGSVVMAGDGESGTLVAVDYATQKFIFFESAATGLANLEKTAAEAYPAGSTVRVTVTGT